MFEVGEKARVTIGPGKTCRCLVLCLGASDDGPPSYDVLLMPPVSSVTPSSTSTQTSATRPNHPRPPQHLTDDGTEKDKEICGVLARDLSPLQPFELDGSLENALVRSSSPRDASEAREELSVRAEALKDKGNILFKLGDTEAAEEVFLGVLRTLEPAPGVGGAVFIKTTVADAIRYRPGMVSDASSEDGLTKTTTTSPVTYDVIYDENDDDGEDEEDGIEADRVVPVSDTAPCVSCAARLNLARCMFRTSRHAEVVDACTLVISLAKLLMTDKTRSRDERLKLRGHCLTALRMRGGSHLAQNHIGLARKDARSMARSAGDDEGQAQATRFEAEVERKAKSLLKANRKLAKDVSQWVNTSMAKHEEAGVTGETSSGTPTQLPEQRLEQKVALEEYSGGGVEESKGNRESGGGAGGMGSWLGSWRR